MRSAREKYRFRRSITATDFLVPKPSCRLFRSFRKRVRSVQRVGKFERTAGSLTGKGRTIRFEPAAFDYAIVLGGKIPQTVFSRLRRVYVYVYICIHFVVDPLLRCSDFDTRTVRAINDRQEKKRREINPRIS